jgi:glucose-1-phosphate cytidylyltransferase
MSRIDEPRHVATLGTTPMRPPAEARGMKVVLFCGGPGMQLPDTGERVPRPLIPVGDRAVLVHLMKYFAHFGHTDFVLCLGEGGRAVKDHFLRYDEALQNDFVLSGAGRRVDVLARDLDDWKLTFVDTGRETSIGGRLRAVLPHLAGEERFIAAYGDQLTDAPLDARLAAFRASGKVASVLSVRPPYSTHTVSVADDGSVTGLATMRDGDMWVNGGFFLFRREIFDYLRPGEDLLAAPVQRLVADGELLADRHDGFWATMETLKDKSLLDGLADSPAPPWAVWERRPARTLAPAAAGAILAA